MKHNKNIIFIAGHRGMLGSAIYRFLKNKKNIIIKTATKEVLNLENYKATYNYLRKNKINQVYMCAAKVGGILANHNNPVDFLEKNTILEQNIIKACFKNNINKLLLFGSSCIYPVKKKKIKEKDFLSGPLEKTNESYAVAKIFGIRLANSYVEQYPEKKLNYRTMMPCNLFGPNDNYDDKSSHVLAALIKKIIISKKKNDKSINIWGDGKSRREFLHVDHVAKASYLIMNLKKQKKKLLGKNNIVNIGSGKDFSIKEIALLICKILKYKPIFNYDKSKPNGVRKKLLDSDLIRKCGWNYKSSFFNDLKKHVLYLEKSNFF